jgi:hypothetical protein
MCSSVACIMLCLSLTPLGLGAQQTPGGDMTCLGSTAACNGWPRRTQAQQCNRATRQQSNGAIAVAECSATYQYNPETRPSSTWFYSPPKFHVAPKHCLILKPRPHQTNAHDTRPSAPLHVTQRTQVVHLQGSQGSHGAPLRGQRSTQVVAPKVPAGGQGRLISHTGYLCATCEFSKNVRQELQLEGIQRVCGRGSSYTRQLLQLGFGG